jgi:hypothetical protein
MSEVSNIVSIDTPGSKSLPLSSVAPESYQSLFTSLFTGKLTNQYRLDVIMYFNVVLNVLPGLEDQWFNIRVQTVKEFIKLIHHEGTQPRKLETRSTFSVSPKEKIITDRAVKR